MPRKLRFFNMTVYRCGKQYQAYLAAYTKKRAVELFEVSRYEADQYMSEAMPSELQELCRQQPETVLYYKSGAWPRERAKL